MSAEETDLERRVLAHERILQAVIAELAAADEGLLGRLGARFPEDPLVRPQHDHTDTASHAEQFIRQVIRLAAIPGPATPASGPPAPTASPPKAAGPPARGGAEGEDPQPEPGLIRFELSRRRGVWSVRQDGLFFGDYYSREPALAAARRAAAAIVARGGEAVISEVGLA